MKSLGSMIIIMISLCISSAAFGYISGTVTDESGAPVAGALVSFYEDEHHYGNVSKTTTDKDGVYQFYTIPYHTKVDDNTPTSFSLGQNYPNPFNPSTTIPFTLDSSGRVTLNIYAITGQRIRTLVDEYMTEGMHAVAWNGSDDSGDYMAAGIYLYRLSINDRTETLKMLMVDGGGNNWSGPKYGGVEKMAASQIFWIEVTGDHIFLYKEDYRLIHDGDVCNFTVQRKPTTPEETLFASIPGGTFQMGDETGDLGGYCRPVHEVTISSFEISVVEVTNLQYATFLNEALGNGEITATDSTVTGVTGEFAGLEYIFLAGRFRPYPSYPENNCKIHYIEGSFEVESGCEYWPVTWITWFGSKAFAEYYGFDLPREAEWEYVARGGQQFLYGTDNGEISDFFDNLNINSSGFKRPVPVGSYKPNPYGIYDMCGNVFEWIYDWFGVYSEESISNPQGSGSGIERILRGGSFVTADEDDCRTAAREWTGAYARSALWGFRVVRRP